LLGTGTLLDRAFKPKSVKIKGMRVDSGSGAMLLYFFQ
jgi:hypothetical protein